MKDIEKKIKEVLENNNVLVFEEGQMVPFHTGVRSLAPTTISIRQVKVDSDINVNNFKIKNLDQTSGENETDAPSLEVIKKKISVDPDQIITNIENHNINKITHKADESKNHIRDIAESKIKKLKNTHLDMSDELRIKFEHVAEVDKEITLKIQELKRIDSEIQNKIEFIQKHVIQYEEKILNKTNINSIVIFIIAVLVFILFVY